MQRAPLPTLTPLAVGPWQTAVPKLADPATRTRLLEPAADRLDESRNDLVAVAHQETALGRPRLANELSRTSFQLRLFVDVIREGSWWDASIDHSKPEWVPAARPDLRRFIRPVAVFGSSNFSFAFSVLGGDTASALAAGCPGGDQGSPFPSGDLCPGLRRDGISGRRGGESAGCSPGFTIGSHHDAALAKAALCMATTLPV